MMSPPQTDTDAKVASKAAKTMGMRGSVSRRSSTREKGKSRGKQIGVSGETKLTVFAQLYRIRMLWTIWT